MRHRTRLRQMTRGLIVTTLGWGALVLVAWRVPPTWPANGDDWYTFAVVVLAIEFLTVMSWLMAVRSWTFDRLTAALVTANAMFSLNFLWFFVIRARWPTMRRMPWSIDVQHILLTALLLALLWGLIEFWRVPDPPEEA
jgi:hypothetical protein